jgi:hypothetical protein
MDGLQDFGRHGFACFGVVGVDLVFVAARLEAAPVALPAKNHAVMLAGLVAERLRSGWSVDVCAAVATSLERESCPVARAEVLNGGGHSIVSLIVDPRVGCAAPLELVKQKGQSQYGLSKILSLRRN